MKVALVCKVYPTLRPGGMGFVCQDRARQLVKSGYEVHVLTTGLHPHKGWETDDQGVRVHHMPCKAGHYSEEFTQHLVTHCKNFQPNILHLDSFDVSRPWWKEFKGNRHTRLAVTMHGFCWGAYFTQLNQWKRGEWGFPAVDAVGTQKEYELLKGFDSVIGISRHEHWMLQDLMGLFRARLVYNPLPSYFFRPVVNPPEKLRWLCSAVSGHSQRGFHLAQRAAEQVGAELVIAGNRSRQEMPEVIDSCLGLVLPTAYAQGCDLAVAETLARGRPVIASATGSYLREAEGIYKGGIKLVPQVGVDQLAIQLSRFPTWFRGINVDIHKPEVHARHWIEAIL